jgi:SPFH domain/Band 7 family protein
MGKSQSTFLLSAFCFLISTKGGTFIMFHRYKILTHERGLLFREGDFIDVLRPGVHWYFDPLLKMRMEKVSPRDPWLRHDKLDLIVKSGLLGNEAIVIDLKDHERALVWIDNRFTAIVDRGLYVLWTTEFDIRVEIVDARVMQLVHADLPAIVRSKYAAAMLETLTVQPGCVALWFRDGAYQATLGPGAYAFWKGAGTLKVHVVDMKEQVLDISGQEIMTADKVTLRINALVAYRITDALRSVTEVDEAAQALYRSAQLALREAVGARDLDALLAGKEALARELTEMIAPRAGELGIQVVTIGVRDIILPGDMKDLMNRVTEAKKAAEASLITRREETAAMRMQANTAKILESSPTLMKLKELEVLEKVADKANLTVVLGDEGLSNRVVKLL